MSANFTRRLVGAKDYWLGDSTFPGLSLFRGCTRREQATQGEVFLSSERDQEFVDFVRAASPRLLKAAWFLSGDAVQAEELVQAALERVYLRWGHLRDASPVAYTRKVLLNLHIDQQRRRSREVATANLPERPRTDVGLEDGEYVVSLLRELPLRERQVVVLRYYIGLSEAETAETLNISTGTVKSSASRGLAKLRDLHTPEEDSHVR